MKLRRPHDTLGGCVWLPRFLDKARHHFAGTLDPAYQRSFCNPRGIDGFFFAHFALTADEILAAAQHADDEAFARWFCSRPASSAERIAAWNEFAPKLGQPDQPGEQMLKWALQNVYPGCTDPRANSCFTVLAWDEGYLDEISYQKSP